MYFNFVISLDLWLLDIVYVFDKILKFENVFLGLFKEDEIYVVDNDFGNFFLNFARIEVN